MAVTSVGTPANTHAAAGSVTGTWGAGQTRTAGNWLIAVVTAAATTSITVDISTAAAGWAQLVQVPNSATVNAEVACWGRIATGADTAPAFTVTGGGTVAMDCMLFELAGVNLIPVDTFATYASGAAAGTLAMTATTQPFAATAGEYAIACFAQERAAAALTWTDTGTGGFAKILNGNGATSVLQTYVGTLSGPSVTAQLNDAGSFSANTTAFGAGLVILFTIPATAATLQTPEVFTNNAAGTVTAGGTTAPAQGTSETWTASVTAAFPVASPLLGQFHVCDPALRSEQMLVTAAPGGTGSQSWTVTRGAEGTTPAAHAAGFSVSQVVTSGDLTSLVSNTSTANWITLPQSWYSGAWFTAKATGFSSPAWILFDGDSIMQGVSPVPTGYIATGWPDKLRAILLAAGVTLYGDHYGLWSYSTGSGAVNPVNEGFSAYAGGASTYEGGFGTLLDAAATAAWVQTIDTENIPGWTTGMCTGFDIVHFDWGACTWGFDIDGGQGSPVPTVVGATWNGSTQWTVTNTGGGYSGNVKKVTVRGLTAGPHVIRWGQVTSAGNAMPFGFSLFTGAATGVGFVRNCYLGHRMVDAATVAGASAGYAGSSNAFPYDRIALWSGAGAANNLGGSGTAQITPVPFGFPTQPTLAFIGWGINDAASSINLQAFGDALQRRIIAIRRGVPNANIVIVAHAYPDSHNSDNNLAGNGGRYNRWKTVMSDVAATYNCAYVDIDSKWGGTPVAQGFMLSGDIHVTQAGTIDIANVLAKVI